MSDPHRRQSEDPRGAKSTEARKKYDQAAFRVGMPFILLPIFVNPILLMAGDRHWFPHSLLLTALLAVGWVVLICAFIIFGLSRIKKYKRDRPFEG